MISTKGYAEISIEEMVEDIEMLIWEQGVSEFKVTEDFEKRGRYTYLVRGLNVEIEDEYVMCGDHDKIIINNNYTLMMFLKNSIKSIHRVVIDGTPHGELYFNSGGTIMIEIAA